MSISPARSEIRLKKSQEEAAKLQTRAKLLEEGEGLAALRVMMSPEDVTPEAKTTLAANIDAWEKRAEMKLEDIPSQRISLLAQQTHMDNVIRSQVSALARDKAAYPRLLKKHLRLCKRYGMADKLGRTASKVEG